MITSRSNQLVKLIRRLNQKKYRQREGLGFVEGLRSTLTVVEQRPELIQHIILSPDLLKRDGPQQKIASLLPHVEPNLISSELFESLSSRENPIGLGTVVKTPLVPLDQFQYDVFGCQPILLLDRLSDPGNLGTILRTADGVGAAGVILCGSGADVLHPTAVKASMGTLFSVQVAHADKPSVMRWIQAQSIKRIATSAKGGSHYQLDPFEKPFLLMMGNEGEGLDADLQALADQQLMIPMRGQASSLNVSVATGVLLYHLTRGGEGLGE